MYYYNSSWIPTVCAWQECSEICVAEWNENGKLKYLPSCSKHRNIIEQKHNLYKRVGCVFKEVNFDRFQDDKKIEALKLKIEVLIMEIKQRLEFTSKIKEIYRDEGHNFYIRYLFDQAQQVLQQITYLKTSDPTLYGHSLPAYAA